MRYFNYIKKYWEIPTLMSGIVAIPLGASIYLALFDDITPLWVSIFIAVVCFVGILYMWVAPYFSDRKDLKAGKGIKETDGNTWFGN